MIAGTLDTVGLAVWSYDLLITHFGDPSALATLGWHLVMDVFLVGATTMLAQVFFAWRIWKVRPAACVFELRKWGTERGERNSI